MLGKSTSLIELLSFERQKLYQQVQDNKHITEYVCNKHITEEKQSVTLRSGLRETRITCINYVSDCSEMDALMFGESTWRGKLLS